LLKCVNRILTGATGETRILGRSLQQYSQAELAKRVGYVPQAEARHFDFRVFEFVLMARYPHLSPFTTVSEKDEQAVWEALRLTGTDQFADRLHGTLSGGERQKVLIAAALAQDAQILLLDEPTTFLDPRHQSDVLDILHRVNRESGVTVVSVTHDVNIAALTSDRVLALKNGRVVFCGAPGELMNNAVLDAVFDKQFLFVTHPDTAQPLVVPEVVR
jgi:iron complex transport system ATP-binding protein